MVHEKWKLLEEVELDKFLILTKKLYSIEDMINLGISAFLHDISFKKNIPNMTSNYRFSIQDQKLYDLHPSEGFHIAKMLNLGFEIEGAIYQHCERFDGSGFPNETMPRFFSRYAPILIFAEYFIESTTINPFQDKPIDPRDFLMNLLTNERHKFDGDVIYAFIRAASLYPVGTWVFLKDEKIGMVTDVNKSQLERPVIMVFLDEKLNKIKPYKIDLSADSNTIVNQVNFSSIRNRFKDTKREIWAFLNI
jgi:HD-GYP domain-containing protein (c-di-GMP phosphodiesterase class II)